MDEKKFLKVFRNHAKKMKEFISYKVMIMNLKKPQRMWRAHCPFFKKKMKCPNDKSLRGTYLEINKSGKVVPVLNSSSGSSLYKKSREYYSSNHSPDLIEKMISIIKDLQKE